MVSTPPPARPPRPCPAGVLTEGGPRSQGRKHLAGSAEPSRVARPKAVASRRSDPAVIRQHAVVGAKWVVLQPLPPVLDGGTRVLTDQPLKLPLPVLGRECQHGGERVGLGHAPDGVGGDE